MNSTPGNARFATTRWTLVQRAAEDSDESSRALSELCQLYWFPLYAFVRRRGVDRSEAEDITQSFFQRLLERNDVAGADPDRGRFRSYLMASMTNYLSNWRRDEHALKRGGGCVHLSIDFDDGERRLQLAGSSRSAESEFERRWAMALLERAIERLRDECAAADRLQWFEHLKPHLGGGRGAPYAELAEQLDTTVGALKAAAHRFRRRCRELVREEIAHTVDDGSEVDDEIQHFFSVLES
ncbi:MAG: sigma-70 family RNA polymerase sigma factor [Pirellulaceae bacterium]|jgi:RNA polymerase sigma-70 factor (ECF subfamily)|nr:sigma-70 family RNA polymerase sigma factor [Pirellulaceae bacterium]MDP7019730.1 sigma-70 family RNA polymerase sigma factor [Pirellulaceae bacterium]